MSTNSKLSALTAVVTPADADLLYMVQSTTSKKATLLQIRAWSAVAITGGTIVGPTIDNCVIGSITPAAGDFTTVNTTGNSGFGEASPLNRVDISGGLVVGATYSGAQTAPTNGALFEGSAVFGNTVSVGGSKVTISKPTVGSAVGLVLHNASTAAANTGSELGFIGVGSAKQASIFTSWDGAASTDAYIGFITRGSSSNTEKLRITSEGIVQIRGTTGALQNISLTTTERNALTAVNGMQIYNETTNQMEGYINSAWAAM